MFKNPCCQTGSFRQPAAVGRLVQPNEPAASGQEERRLPLALALTPL
ncbi:hypothetical protein NGG16_04880 [Enterococcus casseliflavus]|nr:hypothetical protein [Enterococcus casseliflavus]MEB8416775.1 hypothetical protein [Enterococcus casseliflavus]